MDDISYILNSGFSYSDAGKMHANAVKHIEKIVITKVLERSSGNQVTAAKRLGLHRNTLRSKIRKLNIDMEKFKK